MKTCTGCGETKPVSEFYLDKRWGIPRSRCKVIDTIDNIQPLCRSCNARKGTDTIDYRLAQVT